VLLCLDVHDQRLSRTLSDGGGGGGVESLSDAVQRELERDLVVQALTTDDDDVNK